MDELLTDPTLWSATVQQRRSVLGQTQEAAARSLGVTLRTLVRWEAGRALPRADVLGRALAWLGLEVRSASASPPVSPGTPAGGVAECAARPGSDSVEHVEVTNG